MYLPPRSRGFPTFDSDIPLIAKPSRVPAQLPCYATVTRM